VLGQWAGPAPTQLLVAYRQVNGAALFHTDLTDVWSAGFVFLPISMWDEAQVEMLQWLRRVNHQDDPDALPAWGRSAIPVHFTSCQDPPTVPTHWLNCSAASPA